MTSTCIGEDAFSISGNIIKHVIAGFRCVSIPSSIVRIETGSKTNYAFLPGVGDVETVDFSKATNLEYIGDFAFYNCNKLKSVDFSNCTNLATIGTCCFYCCSGLGSVKFPEVCKITTLYSGSFCKTGIKTFTIPNSVKTLQGVSSYNDYNDGVFAYSTSLTEVLFQKTSKCTSISSKAFFGTKIRTITFPASVTSLHTETFRVCSELETIYVESGNTVFSSKDGVLLSNGGTRIFYYPNKAVKTDTIVIPSGVTSIGQAAFIGDSYKYIDMTGITEICAYAFDRFTSLVSATIPATVTTLNDYTFNQCSSLTNITFKGTYNKIPTCFCRMCTSLKTFNIPSGVVTVGNSAFYECTKLTKVYLPKTVTTIETGAFSSCHSSLELIFETGSPITFTNGYLYSADKSKLIIYLGTSTSITIINTVKTIGVGAFRDKNITSFTYASIDNVTSIEDEAFMNVKTIKRIDLPAEITRISTGLFRGSSIESVSIPSKVTTIYEYAFRDCSNLKTVTFSTNVIKDIQKEAFYSTSKLTTITFPDSVERIRLNAFSYSGILTFNVPWNLIMIYENAFLGSSLKTIVFPTQSIYSTIHRTAFKSTKLESLAFPDYVQIIEENSFSYCTSLTTVTIGKNVTSIGDNAFQGCTALTKIIIGNNTVLNTISSLSFEGCTSLKEFSVNSGTNNFYFATGILFNRQQTEVIIFLKATNVKIVVIPSKVTSISSYAFANSNSVENVTFLGSGIQKISPYSFYKCTSLTYINFPSSLQSIGIFAFYKCAIKSLNLGSITKMTSILDSVFADNLNLKQVFISSSITQISSSAFENAPRAYIVYLGSQEIKHTVGFKPSSVVFVSDNYAFDTFSGIKVVRNMYMMCTFKAAKYNMLTTKRLSLIFFVLFT